LYVFSRLTNLTRIFHVSDAFICKTLRGATVVSYCKPLITRQMGVSDSALMVIFQLKKKIMIQSVTWRISLLLTLTF
jgi:hypothetical protein